MSKFGIFIGEVLSELNAPVGGRHFPRVQRQYVCGARNGSKQYVCLLLDSLAKAYLAMNELVRKPDSKAN